MKRRDVLVSACASVAGFAGCSSFASNPRPSDASSPGGTGTPTTPLSEYDCPPHRSGEEPVVCSHTVDTDTASVYLLPGTGTGPGTELVLHNESAAELEFNPYEWSVLERRSSGWTAIEKRTAGNARLVVAPGETHAWTFEEVVGYVDKRATLDAGTYAASISVPDSGGSDWIRCLALVRLGQAAR